jgi:hypothetical protein
MSTTLLGRVHSAKHNGWQNFVTLDETWVYCHTECKSIWLSGDEKAPERERWLTASPKLILTVMWNPVGFHVVDLRVKGVKFCSAYSLSNIMDPILATLRPYQRQWFWKLVMHVDNVCLPTSKMVDECFESHCFRRADHSMHSRDPGPSDSLFFGFIQGQLKGTHFPRWANADI